MKNFISCNNIIELKVITVICLCAHLNERSGVLLAKIHGCSFVYVRLNRNESLIKDLCYITNRIIHKFLIQKQPKSVFQGTAVFICHITNISEFGTAKHYLLYLTPLFPSSYIIIIFRTTHFARKKHFSFEFSSFSRTPHFSRWNIFSLEYLNFQ